MSKLCFLLLHLLFLRSALTLNKTLVRSVDDTFEVIDSALAKLNWTQNLNVVLFVGNANIQSSILIHFVGGNHSQLVSKRDTAIGWGFIIEFEREGISSDPEIVVDADDAPNVWYDFPRFDVRHNKKNQLAKIYLIKKVLETAPNVKIVFALNYHDIIADAHEEEDFEYVDKLIFQGTNLINSTTKLENSLAMIVTEAPPLNQEGAQSEVVEATVQFLKKYRSFLISLGSSDEKIQIIDALLKTNNELDNYSYPRITVFFEPVRPGRLSTLWEMNRYRRLIRTSVYDGISYTNTEKGDLDFLITDEARQGIARFVNEVNNSFSAIANTAIDRILDRILQHLDATDDFNIKFKLLKLGKELIGPVDNASLDILVETLGDFVYKFNVSIDEDLIKKRLRKHENYRKEFSKLIGTIPDPINFTEYLQAISDFLKKHEKEKFDLIFVKANETIKHISTVLAILDGELLTALRNLVNSTHGLKYKLDLLALGNNSIHPVEDVDSLGKWIENFRTLIFEFNITSVDVKLLKIIDNSEKYYDLLKLAALNEMNSTIPDLPIETLKSVSSKSFEYQSTEYGWCLLLEQIYQTFASYEVQKDVIAYIEENMHDLGQSCPEEITVNAQNFDLFIKKFTSMKFQATVVKLTEADEIVNIALKSPQDYEFDDSLKNLKIISNFLTSSSLQGKINHYKPKDISVFVVDTFFVDSDLQFTGKKALKIHARNWNILTNATFDMDGIDESKTAHPNSDSRAGGVPGRHGEPGGTAGHFFGFANKLTNSHLLTVNLNAGNGQHGENGKGSNDRRVGTPSSEYSDSESYSPMYDPEGYLNNKFRSMSVKFNLTRMESDLTKDIIGIIGLMIPSIILTILWDSNKWLQYDLFDNCCGKTGLGGLGGHAGNPGKYNFYVNYEETNNLPKNNTNNGTKGEDGIDGKICKSWLRDVKYFCHYGFTYIIVYEKAWINAYRIALGKEILNPKCPYVPNSNRDKLKFPKAIVEIDEILEVIEYKKFLLQNMKKSTFYDNVIDTYHGINGNSRINDKYEVKKFAMEANALEANFFNVNNLVDILPLYHNFLRRIATFAESGKLLDAEVKILRLIYSAFVGKIVSLGREKSQLIVDVEKYLQKMVDDIPKLEKARRAVFIQNIRNDYMDKMAVLIKEAIGYITNFLQPKINNLFKDLINEIDELMEELKKLQEETADNIRKNREASRKMAAIACVQTALNVISPVTDAFKGHPIGIVVSLGVQAAKAIAEKAKLSIDVKQPIQLPEAVAAFKRNLQKMNTEKFDAIDNEIKKLIESYENNTLGEGDTYQRLTDLKWKLNMIEDRNSVVHNDVMQFLFDSIEIVDDGKKFLAAADKIGKHDKLMKKLEKASNALIGISTSISNFIKYGEEYEAIAKSIKEDEASYKALILFEAHVHNEILPLIENVHKEVEDFEKSLRGDSTVALDIKRFNIRDTLRTFYKRLKETVTGFNVQSNVEDILEQIEATIGVTIDMYQRIQTFEMQADFADYVTKLGSQDIPPSDDEELNGYIKELEFNLKANLILSQYFRAIDTFKQAVFPLAANYLETLELPSSLSIEITNEQSDIEYITENLITLLNYMKLESISVNSIPGETIIHKTFDKNYPFYVWEGVDIHGEIEQLFTGEKVHLLADVKSTMHGWPLNAVKFNQIFLKIYARDEVTNDLNDVLRHFIVAITHTGQSNYRCHQDFYSIYGTPMSVTHGFAVDPHGFPTTIDENYMKLRDSKKILSPFTLWGVQLFLNPNANTSFEQLSRFANSIQTIELHGVGQYLLFNDICYTDLQKYYSILNEK